MLRSDQPRRPGWVKATALAVVCLLAGLGVGKWALGRKHGDEAACDDVVFSFNLCLDPRFDCKKRGNLILNKQPIVATAADPLTVTFRLAEPFYSFPWALAEVFVVPKATFAAVSGSEKTFREAVGVQ